MHQLFIAFLPVLVSLIVQLTKFILYSFKHGLKWNYLFTHGHMPSMHSAFAVSLLITVWQLEGMASGTFAVSIALAFLIIDDALRLRMYLGDQGRYLNMLIQTLNLNPKKYPKLKERVGHRLSEVIVGALYGAILTIVLIHLVSGRINLYPFSLLFD